MREHSTLPLFLLALTGSYPVRSDNDNEIRTQVDSLASLVATMQARLQEMESQLSRCSGVATAVRQRDAKPGTSPPRELSSTSSTWPDFSQLGTVPVGSSASWNLALNVDTSDGHDVNYANLDFWQSGTFAGGASTSMDDALTSDYKDLVSFSLTAKQILVVVHEEGTALGWRTWDAVTPQSLLSIFNTGNTCTSTSTVLSDSVCGTLASGTTGGDVGSLIPQEPLVHNNGDHENLYVNAGTGSGDFNRLSTVCAGSDNAGWGLGTLYDASADAPSSFCSSAYSRRPICDGQLHTGHWGTGTGPDNSGMIGTDNVCNSCGWTIASGFDYDYAIFVSEISSLVCPDGSIAADGGVCRLTEPPTPMPTFSQSPTSAPTTSPPPSTMPTADPTMVQVTSITSTSVATPSVRTEVLVADEIVLAGATLIAPTTRRLLAEGTYTSASSIDLDELAASVKELQEEVASINRRWRPSSVGP